MEPLFPVLRNKAWFIFWIHRLDATFVQIRPKTFRSSCNSFCSVILQCLGIGASISLGTDPLTIGVLKGGMVVLKNILGHIPVMFMKCPTQKLSFFQIGIRHLPILTTQLCMSTDFTELYSLTAWSRKRGLAGTNPLTVPIGLLTRHGAAEFALRALSEGRFMGVVPTRSIPESVFLSQLVKAMRDAAFDLDAIAESMHRKNNPSSAVPNKVDKPAEFMQPLVQLLVDQIASVAPAKQDTAAMRQLQEVQTQLHAAQAKLRQAGVSLTPDRHRRAATDANAGPVVPPGSVSGPPAVVLMVC